MWIRVMNDEADKLRVLCAADPALHEVKQRLDDAEAALSLPTSDRLREKAEEIYTDSDEDVEVDGDAATSRGEKGTWVQGWLWVSDTDME